MNCDFTSEILEGFHKRQSKTNQQLSTYGTVLNEFYGLYDQKIYATKAYDSYIEDFDGNKYIDMALGAGTFILGHSNKNITEKIKHQIDKSSLYIAPNFATHEFAELLAKALPQFERFVFCNTGSEATMRAIRIARAFSGKKKIAMFCGGYHGSHDLVLVDEVSDGKETEPQCVFRSNGIPKELRDFIILLPYNHESAYELIKKNRADIAMVFIEPSQGSNPRDDVGDFLRGLRDVTSDNDILLGFDEIITGFRVAMGGAQEYYGITADIATYGKAAGGGLPLGIVAGKKEVMDTIKTGTEKNPQPIFMGGTFSANPLAMIAGMTILEHLIANKNNIYCYLNEKSAYLKAKVNSFCNASDIPARIYGLNSMMRLIFTDKFVRSRHERDKLEIDIKIQDLFYMAMLNSGIHIASNRLIFLSTKHTACDIERVISAYLENLSYFKARRLF